MGLFFRTWFQVILSMILFTVGEAMWQGALENAPALTSMGIDLTAGAAAIQFASDTQGCPGIPNFGSAGSNVHSQPPAGGEQVAVESEATPVEEEEMPIAPAIFKGEGAYAKAKAHLDALATNPQHSDGNFQVHHFINNGFRQVQHGPTGLPGNWARITFKCHRAGKPKSRGKKQGNAGMWYQ